MSNPPLPPYQYIDTPASWAACLADLRRTDRLAIDIESNSMYVLHEQICLLQISTPDQDYIIDPLLDLDLEALGEIFADSEVEKIFHAAEYDLILIGKQYDWTLNNLFDTMWAARILGYERVGLANMLDELFGFTLDKRYQRANWGERPLSADQLRYAQMDTHFLFQLRDYLAAEITAQDRWVETKETFQQQAQVQMPDDTFDPHRFWSINGVKTLPPRMRAIGFALFTFRYELAEQLNRPLYKLFGDKVLLQLAEEAPTHLSQLHQTKGLSKWFIRRYGRQLLERAAAQQVIVLRPATQAHIRKRQAQESEKVSFASSPTFERATRP